ncbi:MAG: thymidylate synthase [Methylococcales bacterium]|nr:thymidylate synthase [Methylococcales bacterium]
MKVYLDLLAKLIEAGEEKSDRTGWGTFAIFGHQLRINLNEGFPLLTTKKVHFKSVVHELLWFLQGDTHIRYLNDQGVTIWDEWADEQGSLGPIYGQQWRSWRGPDGQVIDQLQQIISTLRTRPDSRRMVVSAWNVADLPDETLSPQQNVHNGKMALAPCHVLFQFYAAGGVLSCQVYQRSCDVFLGLPFNLASYALLTHIVADQVDMQPGDLIWTGGDVHLYKPHLTQARQQLQRSPKPLPTLLINRRPATLFDYRYEDFSLQGYQPDAALKAEVAV